MMLGRPALGEATPVAGRITSYRSLGGDFPHAAPMRSRAQDMQTRIQLDLENLRVRKPCTEAAPGAPRVSGCVDPIIRSDVKGTVDTADL